MSHTRIECEHGKLIAQCRCPAPHRIEVERPCPFGVKCLGKVVVHPLPPESAIGPGLGQVAQTAQEPGQLPAGAPQTPEPVSQDPQNAPGGAEGVGGLSVTAVKLCLFRSCGWTITEPDSLLAVAAMDEEIRAHLRTHRVEIETMAAAIERAGG